MCRLLLTAVLLLCIGISLGQVRTYNRDPRFFGMFSSFLRNKLGGGGGGSSYPSSDSGSSYPPQMMSSGYGSSSSDPHGSSSSSSSGYGSSSSDSHRPIWVPTRTQIVQVKVVNPLKDLFSNIGKFRITKDEPSGGYGEDVTRYESVGCPNTWNICGGSSYSSGSSGSHRK